MEGLALLHRAKLNGSKAEYFHYCLQAYTQFYDNTQNVLTLDGNCGFVIAVEQEIEQPVACIIYTRKSDDEWYIVKSFTSTAYRGKGINAMLFGELKAKAEQNGIEKITSLVKPSNEAMIRSLEKSGRSIVHYVTEFKIGENE